MIRYLMAPEVEPGRGSGHLVRCLELARFLPDVAFLIAQDRQKDLLARYAALGDYRLFSHVPSFIALPDGQLPMVIFDRMFLDAEIVRRALAQAIPVAIDSRGAGLRLVPYVIDLLPRLNEHPAWAVANRQSPEFLAQPIHRREQQLGSLPEKARVLVSFGGEDAAGLGRRLIESGALATCLPRAEVDVLAGPMSHIPLPVLPGGWHHLPAIPVLREELHRYDLVITSFGLTAYEARSAGCRVVLLNPTQYHQKLAVKAGFATIGVLHPETERFRLVLKSAQPVPQAKLAENAIGPRGLAMLLESMPKTIPCSCPGCQASGQDVIARFADRSYFRCGRCGLEFLFSLRPDTMAYDESYFFTDYQKQYGKTYLDDFGHIKAMGDARIDWLLACDPGITGQKLLDIGCAYGPFLAAARDRGLLAHGTDISPAAVRHVNENLGIPALCGDFRKLAVAELGGPFRVVTLWYVIEHFPDLYLVLGRLAGLLEPGGLLALSTPSGEGISARKNRRAFLEQSPADHFSIWKPSQVRRLLARHGLSLLRIRVTGHHPERFPGLLGQAWLRPLSSLISQVFGLGDTFELYAKKNTEDSAK